MHEKNIAIHSKCNLSYFLDINQDFVNEVAKQQKLQWKRGCDKIWFLQTSNKTSWSKH